MITVGTRPTSRACEAFRTIRGALIVLFFGEEGWSGPGGGDYRNPVSTSGIPGCRDISEITETIGDP
eukprot:263924-Amorphochlora_amoeboformis.AAC.1